MSAIELTFFSEAASAMETPHALSNARTGSEPGAPASSRRDGLARRAPAGSRRSQFLESLLLLCACLVLMPLPLPAQSGSSTAYTVTTFAGYPSFGGADGAGSEAQFFYPNSTAVDTNGNVYVADSYNGTIRKITPAGLVSTIAGFAGVNDNIDGSNSLARFFYPQGITTDSAGRLFVTDRSHTIRKLIPSGTNWLVETIAGCPFVTGSNDESGTLATFNEPRGLACDSANNLYVADMGNHTIRRISPVGTNWVVSTVAGSPETPGASNGTNRGALFRSPSAIGVDTNGFLYVADTDNELIRKLAPSGSDWVVTTLAGSVTNAGSADGLGTNALFSGPDGLVISKGKIFVTDFFDDTIRVLTQSGSDWMVGTFAGRAGHFGNVNGTGTNASFGGPVGLSADVAGNLYVADSLNNTIRKVSPAGLVRTLAGASASQGSVDGHGSAARFNQPGGTAIDTAGNIYVSDFGNSTIRAITPLGEVSTLAGVVGSAGNNDGVGTDARFWGPAGLAADSLGNVYVADYYNSTIRSISPAGEVRTLAGLAGSAGTSDGAGASARFYGPVGIAAAGTDTLFIADSGNHTIRKASLIGSAWIITTIAGLGGQPGALNGTNGDSRFNAPFGITVAPDGNLYVADTLNYTIRKISPAGSNWVVATIAGLAGTFGGSDGTNGQATFYNPIALAADSAGNLFVADNFNQTIRKLAPLGADWLVTTVAGAERTAGSADGAGFAARFYFPSGIAVDTDGSFYVADEHNNTIRKGVLTGYTPANAGAFTPPPLSGRLEVTLLPSEANGQWRFAWESGWRASSAPATNLAAGNYPIEYRNLPGYLTISTNLLVAVAGGQTTFVTNQYYPTLNLTGTTNTGALTVNIGPSLLTNSGWRFLGGTSWRAAGSTATDLLPDLYFIEFQPVSGYAKPANQAVQVPAGLTRVISANYLLAGAPPAGVLLPVPVPDSSIADVETWPFDFNGQLQTDAGLGSGVAVETNVVLTAAHLIFNDQTLSYVSRAWWYLRQEVPAFTPEPMPARGWYVLSGYAAQRTNDLFGGLAPDQSSPQSRNLDVAALYFLSPVAGGGFGGYLPSDSTPNSWLTSTANKMLVGYPVDGSLFGDATITNGVMYQTKPQPFPLSLSSEPVSGQQVYTAPWFLSYPGNSGGPLYVQFNGHYYPAGVYVGTLFSGIVPYASAVRAIDGAVAGMIRTAAALGDSGTNNGGGVIAFIPSQTINAGNPGFIQFHLGPPSALHAGAAWRLVGDATWSTAPDWTRTVTSTNAVSVEFKPLAGWTSPSDQSVSVLPGQITYYTALYAVQPPTLVVDALRRIGITGTTGTVYRLEKRSSLASGAWLPLSTNTISSSGFNLVLPAPLTNGPRSFFRALWLP